MGNIPNIILKSDVKKKPMSYYQDNLYFAVLKNNLFLVKRILKNNINLNHAYFYGNTCLIIAAKMGYHNIVTELLNRGADANIQNDYGYNALALAIDQNRIKIVKLLMNYDINLDLLFGNSGMTALFLAIYRNRLEIIKILIKFGVKTNIYTKWKDTPLILATKYGLPEIVELLLKKYNNIDHQDTKGNTALMIAAKNGYLGIFRNLLECKADITIRNNNNNTAGNIIEMNNYIYLKNELMKYDNDIYA